MCVCVSVHMCVCECVCISLCVCTSVYVGIRLTKNFIALLCKMLWKMSSEPFANHTHTHTHTHMKVKVTQSCPTLCDPTEYTVHSIL